MEGFSIDFADCEIFFPQVERLPIVKTSVGSIVMKDQEIFY